jgi:hypothetical protein
MPQARLMTRAVRDLNALDPQLRQLAVDVIKYVEKNPGAGDVVSKLQYAADPAMPRPCSFIARNAAPGIKLFVYFEVEAGELRVYQITKAYIM